MTSFFDNFIKEQQDSDVVDSEKKSPETTIEAGSAPPDYSLPLSEEARRYIQQDVVEKLREIYDPEIPVNIYELGLIYEVAVAEDAKVAITMTLTTPHCPVAESMPGDVQLQAMGVAGVSDVNVDLVWDPPWAVDMMSEAARLEMGFM